MATTPAKANHPFILEEIYVRQDEHGRYSLNDLHQAAGGDPSIRPSEWLRNKQTVELAAEISASNAGISAIETRAGNNGGTYVARELVYSYAMWISPAFNLKVIRTFDALVTGGRVASTTAAYVGAATGLPLAQLQGLQDQSWKLITRLKGETQRVADDSKLRYTSACSKEHGIDVLNGAVMNRLACESKGGFFTSDAPLRRPGRMEPKGSPVLHRYVNFRFGLPPSLTWGMAVTQTVTGA